MKEERIYTDYDPVPVSNLRWSSIFGGTFFGFGIIAILSFFGLAVGAAIAGPRGVNAGAETWAGIWLLVTLFVGFLAGGWMAARTSGAVTHAVGRLHGLVTWGLGTAALLYFAMTSTTRLGSFLASVTGSFGRVSANAGTVEGMTMTAAVWATVAAICGLIGGLVGGHAGVKRRRVVAATDIRRVA
jgi:hypothetical protein